MNDLKSMTLIQEKFGFQRRQFLIEGQYKEDIFCINSHECEFILVNKGSYLVRETKTGYQTVMSRNEFILLNEESPFLT